MPEKEKFSRNNFMPYPYPNTWTSRFVYSNVQTLEQFHVEITGKS